MPCSTAVRLHPSLQRNARVPSLRLVLEATSWRSPGLQPATPLRYLAAAFTVAWLAGCGSAPAISAITPSVTALPTPGSPGSKVTRAELVGRWQVVRVSDGAYLGCECFAVNRTADLSFTATGTVTGSDGVNTWASHFSTSGTTLSITPGTGTLIGVGPGAPLVQRDLQAAYAALMKGGTVGDWMFGRYLALDVGRFVLLLARASRA